MSVPESLRRGGTSHVAYIGLESLFDTAAAARTRARRSLPPIKSVEKSGDLGGRIRDV
jgi:hypothetical protein